jgi:hypothetical protein
VLGSTVCMWQSPGGLDCPSVSRDGGLPDSSQIGHSQEVEPKPRLSMWLFLAVSSDLLPDKV